MVNGSQLSRGIYIEGGEESFRWGCYAQSESCIKLLGAFYTYWGVCIRIRTNPYL